MNNLRPSEEALFDALSQLQEPQRGAALEEACGGDVALRHRLEVLLAAHDRTNRFMAQSVGPNMPDGWGLAIPLAERLGDQIGPYKLIQQIGEGGCGVVYMAQQQTPVRRLVALKIIKLGMDTRQVVARFEAERQALAMMDHPNIAKVLDAGATDTGRPFFVMELVRGIKITDYCDLNQLSTMERLELFAQACRAVQHAHQKGIIHRDLKPSNILVTINDGVPVPKVIDFGIAKATQCRLTERTLVTAFDQFIGTPAYVSPEQAVMTTLDIDTRSDIYSLGVLLYELLTGKTPFDTQQLLAAGLDELRRTIREQLPMRPSTRLSSLGNADLTTLAKARRIDPGKLTSLLRGDLDWIVMKCLEKDRTRRYETASGLARDIERHLRHEPVLARPPSRLYEFQRTVQRHWVGFAAASAILAALAFGVVVSVSEAVRARRAEQEQFHLSQAARAAQAKEANQRQRAEAGELSARRNLYAAKMNLAQVAWEQGSVGRVRQLLEETASYSERGFEWYYWYRESHLELKTIRRHLAEVTAVATSPDGRRIATGSMDGSAIVWDAVNGHELLVLSGHRGGILSVAFSSDGRWIVTASFDQTTRVWDAASGQGLRTFQWHGGPVCSAVFSPDGHSVLAGFADATAKLWETTGGKEILLLRGHMAPIRSVAFSSDGQRIATASMDQTAKVWDARSGKELLTLAGHGDWVDAVAFSPDCHRIVTGSYDQTAKVWDAFSGNELRTFRGHKAHVLGVAFSPDGERIVTGSEDETAKVWETATGQELFNLKGHADAVLSVAFCADGQRIVTGSADDRAKVWQAINREEPLTLGGHDGKISSAAFSPDGKSIAAGAGDATALVWEAATGKVRLKLRGHSAEISSVAYSPNGQRIVTGSQDQTAKLWEAASGTELHELRGHSSWIRSVAFSPDGRLILTGSADQTAKVWETGTGKLLLTLAGHTAGVWSVAFSLDGNRIVTGSADHTAKIWLTATGKELLTLKGHSDGVSSVAFSPDGEQIVTGSWDETAKVWDAAGGQELLNLRGHRSPIRSVAFSPDGQRIVTGSEDGTAKVWGAAGGNELLSLKGHHNAVLSVASSADGRRIVTGSSDETVKVWQAATAQDWAAREQAEREADSRIEVLRHKERVDMEKQRALRAQDEGAIKQWLVLAPISFETRDGSEALDHEQIPHEASLRPYAGERVNAGQTQRVWSAVRQGDYLVNFDQLMGEKADSSLAYGVSYIESEADQPGLIMQVGSDAGAKVYLNGREIYRHEGMRNCLTDQEAVTGADVRFRAGLNVLVFKVLKQTGYWHWQGSIRFTDSAGNPVKGIRVTLTPPQV